MTERTGAQNYPHVRTVTVQFQVEAETRELVEWLAEYVADNVRDQPELLAEYIVENRDEPDDPDTKPEDKAPPGDFKIWTTATGIEGLS